MGKVFLGQRGPGGRPAAIKVIAAKYAEDPDFLERFSREVDACRRLGGNCTPAVQGADCEGLRPWLAVDYVRAPTLRDLVVEYGGPLPPSAVLWLGRELAHILEVLEKAEVFHRDIKPSNVLITEDGPKLIDFGLVRDDRRPSLAHDQLLGTAGYMAPEQINRGTITAATDVYGLGGVLYYAAVGSCPPYDPDTYAVPRLSDGRPDLPDLPAELSALVAKCLKRTPADRRKAAGIVGDVNAHPALRHQDDRLGARAWLPDDAYRVLQRYARVEIPAPRAKRLPSVVTNVEARTAGPTRLLPAWSFRLSGKGYYASPVVADGVVFAAGLDGVVHALKAADGAEIWQTRMPGKVECTLAVADGVVVVSCADHHVHALDATSGAQRWSHATGSTVPSAPTIAGATAYVGCRDGAILALALGSGERRWIQTADQNIFGRPCLDAGTQTVFAGSWDCRLHAVDAATGVVRWRFLTEGAVHAAPVVAEGSVYVASGDRTLYAVDANTGRERWRYATAGPVTASPAIADGQVWLGSCDGDIHVVEAATGEQLGRYRTGGQVHSSPTIRDGWAYIGSRDGFLYAVPYSAARHWRWFQTDGWVDSTPTVEDSMVFLGSWDGHVYAVNLATLRDDRWGHRAP